MLTLTKLKPEKHKTQKAHYLKCKNLFVVIQTSLKEYPPVAPKNLTARSLSNSAESARVVYSSLVSFSLRWLIMNFHTVRCKTEFSVTYPHFIYHALSRY